MSIQGANEISINAKPEEVWTVLADSTYLPRWAAMVKSTTGTTERVGSRRTCQVEWEGRRDEVVERCIEASPPRRIRWEMEQGMMSQFFSLVQFGFRLEPNGKESTLVQLEFLYQPKNIVARLMYALMMRRKLDELRQTLLGNLKTLIEQREVRLKS